MTQRARVGVAAVVLALWGGGACGDGISAQSTAAPAGQAAPRSSAGTPGAAVVGGESPSSPGEDELAGTTENGQTGSLGPVQCSSDAYCNPVLESWAAGDAEYELLDSGCEHSSSGLPPYLEVAPVCVCDVSVTRSRHDPRSGEVYRQAEEELFFLRNDGRWDSYFGPECLLSGGLPGTCSYCAHEFPGCNDDADVNECAAYCTDLVQRLRAQAQVAHDVELRTARCNEQGWCEIVYRLEDTCYNQRGVPAPCSLSDAEIIAAMGERPNAGVQCERPALPCASAADCPAGLGCNGSVCGLCLGPEDGCISDDTGECSNDDFVCGQAEQCVSGTCILAERAECVASTDCPTTDPDFDQRVCLLTGVDYQSGRGNEQTRSFCSGSHPNPFGLRVGDVLEARVLGPGSAVEAEFEPPVRSPQQDDCKGASGLRDRAPLRLRVDHLSTPPYSIELAPRATLLDALSSVAPVPEPVHARDRAQGRQLWNKLSSPGNHATVVMTPFEPTELTGCPGTYNLRLTSAIERLPPGSPPADGGFGRTLLEYGFSTAEGNDDDPECIALGYFCRELWQVEVTRLTP